MDSKVKGLMGDSFENLRTLIDVNTIIGDPITTPDGTTIIPVSKVTFCPPTSGRPSAAPPPAA